MIEQQDVDRLQAELEQLRDVFTTDRGRLLPLIESLREQVDTLLADPEPGKLEPTVQNISRLLESLHRSIAAQSQLTTVLRRAA